MDNYTIDSDRFAASMEQLLVGIPDELDPRIGVAAEAASKVGRRAVKKYARAKGLVRTQGYVKNWAYRVKKTPEGWTAEIGNKKKPGLAHLLEKGHARVGGGPRVPGYEHIATAADDTFEAFQKSIREAVDSL